MVHHIMFIQSSHCLLHQNLNIQKYISMLSNDYEHLILIVPSFHPILIINLIHIPFQPSIHQRFVLLTTIFIHFNYEIHIPNCRILLIFIFVNHQLMMHFLLAYKTKMELI